MSKYETPTIRTATCPVRTAKSLKMRKNEPIVGTMACLVLTAKPLAKPLQPRTKPKPLKMRTKM
ncbi:MAG: hypothetical protein LBG52_08350 [Candidatus Peribacteria bacterium]|nr:hypothetical protein [Candidatus Peribacteria bacterium]